MRLKVLGSTIEGPYQEDYDLAADWVVRQINQYLSLGWEREGSLTINTSSGFKYGRLIQVMIKD